jgi:hypothetical protein
MTPICSTGDSCFIYNICTCLRKLVSNTISISNSNTAGVINIAGTASPSGVHEFIPAFSGVHDAQPLIFSLVFCRSLFDRFVLSVLRCTASDYLPLISLKCSYTKQTCSCQTLIVIYVMWIILCHVLIFIPRVVHGEVY